MLEKIQVFVETDYNCRFINSGINNLYNPNCEEVLCITDKNYKDYINLSEKVYLCKIQKFNHIIPINDKENMLSMLSEFEVEKTIVNAYSLYQNIMTVLSRYELGR